MSENREPNPLCVQLGERLKKADRVWDKRVKQIEKFRKYMAGQIGEDRLDDEVKLVRANVLYATVHGLLQHIYARNPDVSVLPSEQVRQPGAVGSYPALRAFAKTLEIVVSREMADGGQKACGKACVLGSLTSAIAWAKVTYQRELTEDPLIQDRIQDTQDEIQRLDKLLADLEDESKADPELRREELKNLLAALEARVEVVASEGLVMEPVTFEDLRFDPSLRELTRFRQARWAAQRIWMTREEAEERFPGADVEQITRFPVTAMPLASGEVGSAQGDEYAVAVWELWDRATMRVYTFAEGGKDWLREPFSPERLGHHWYPFFPLVLYPLEGRRWPLSLAEQLTELQDEYNATRTQLAEHRAISLPHWIADKTTDKDSLSRYRDAAIGEVVLVDAQGRPLNQVIMAADPPPFNPAVYDTAPVRVDIDMISGLQDANRGAVIKAKTATEAEIQQQGLASRVAEMRDAIEDWMAEMARYSAEILLQELSPEQVQRIAGPQASWPQLAKDEVFDLVQVSIRAGTSGKPDKRREQETWAQLLPMIQQLLAGIQQAQMAGADATAPLMMLKETLRRFDERIDVEEFLPQLGGLQNGVDPQMAMQMQQSQQQIQMLQQALQETEARAQQAEAAAADKEQDRALKREEMDMRRQEGEGKAKGERERVMLDAIMKALPMLQAKKEREEKEGEDEAREDLLARAITDTQGSVAQALESLSRAMDGLAASQSAPRQLVRDEQGRPSGVVVAPASRNLQ